MDIREIHTEDVFVPSRSKVKGQGYKRQERHFSDLSAACVRFMIDKTF